MIKTKQIETDLQWIQLCELLEADFKITGLDLFWALKDKIFQRTANNAKLPKGNNKLNFQLPN